MKPSQRGDFHGALGNKQYTCVGTDVECERTGDSIGSAVKNLSVMQEPQQMRVQSLGREDPLEEGTATHSRILAWRIPWTEEPGGLQSSESQRVRHD